MAKFDPIIRGGRVINPARGIDGVRDLALKNGTIVQAAPRVPVSVHLGRLWTEENGTLQDGPGVRIKTDTPLKPVVALRAGQGHRSPSPLREEPVS